MFYSDVSGRHELKIFQHYGYFSSDSAEKGSSQILWQLQIDAW